MALKTIYTDWYDTTSNTLQFRGMLTEQSTDTVGNTSVIDFALQLRRKSGDAILYSWHAYITVEGTQYMREASTTVGKSAVTVTTLAGLTVGHDADGKKTLVIPVTLKTSYYDGQADMSFELTAIPRASSVSLITSSVPAGGTLAIGMSRASDAFYHKAGFYIGSTLLATSDAFSASLSYPVPMDWLRSVTGATSQKITVKVQTYSDSSCTTAVGEAVSSAFTMTVPEDIRPVAQDDAWAVIDPVNDGASAGFAAYVQGYSRAHVTIDTGKINSTEDRYGAALKSVSVVAAGKTYALDLANGNIVTTDVLVNPGTVTVTVTLVDSRGRTLAKTQQIEVYAYTPPAIKGISIYRSTGSHVASETGSYISITADAAYSECGGENTVTIKYRAYATDAQPGAWTSLALNTPTLYGNGTLSDKVTYVVELLAEDSLGNTAGYTAVIPTATVAFHLREGNRGAALGKYAEEDELFDVDYAIRAKGSISVDDEVMSAEDIAAAKGAAGTSQAAAGIAQAAAETANAAKTAADTLSAAVKVTAGNDGIGLGTDAQSGRIVAAWPIYDVQGNEIGAKPEDDTGWVDLGLASGISAGTNTLGNYVGVAYRKIGKRVIVAANVALSWKSSVQINATLIPQQLRPQRSVYAICPTGGRYVIRAYANPEGAVHIEWAQNLASSSSTSSATISWTDIWLEYFVE